MAEIGYGFPNRVTRKTIINTSISGTYSYRVPDLVTELLLTGIGGGGGGGGDSLVDGANFGGGGGSGAYARDMVISVVPGSTITVVVGSAGPEATVGTATTITYQHRIFGQSVITLGPGGGGGVGNNTPGTAGTPTHVGALSTITLGLDGLYSGVAGTVSNGAASPFGSGGVGGSDANGSSPAATSYGSGGGGAQISAAPARNGAAGANGYVNIDYVPVA